METNFIPQMKLVKASNIKRIYVTVDGQGFYADKEGRKALKWYHLDTYGTSNGTPVATKAFSLLLTKAYKQMPRPF